MVSDEIQMVLALLERPRHLWSALRYGLAVVMFAFSADPNGLPTVTGGFACVGYAS